MMTKPETPYRQKALAYNRLGRSYTSQGENDQALISYDKAISYDAQNPELYSNRGLILKKMGNYEQALEQFEQALKINPQDKLAALFKQEVERSLTNLDNSERQQRLDSLINNLVEAYHRQKTIPPVVEEKTAESLTITFLNFKGKDTMSGRAGEVEYILLKLMDYLGNTGKVKVVERQLIERLLEELKLGSSELADPRVSARLGRILAARLIVTGSIVRGRVNLL
jgi:tetratricopeptide (TPR) repeat protein